MYELPYDGIHSESIPNQGAAFATSKWNYNFIRFEKLESAVTVDSAGTLQKT